jgi:hypothetical protein
MRSDVTRRAVLSRLADVVVDWSKGGWRSSHGAACPVTSEAASGFEPMLDNIAAVEYFTSSIAGQAGRRFEVVVGC